MAAAAATFAATAESVRYRGASRSVDTLPRFPEATRERDLLNGAATPFLR